jgi:hypothetical protein
MLRHRELSAQSPPLTITLTAWLPGELFRGLLLCHRGIQQARHKVSVRSNACGPTHPARLGE